MVWLYIPQLSSLSPAAQQHIETSDLLISPMVALELEYLHEIGRLTVRGNDVVQSLTAQLGLRVCDQPFPPIVDRALAQTWTRDPFDRIIAAHAMYADRPLVTRDDTIRANCPVAVW